jgi:hypothetical protein
MNIIRNFDANVDVDEGIDEKDQGPDTQGASVVAPNAQSAMNNGEQKGANKRSHDTIVVPGHKVHSSRAQRMSETDSNRQSSNTAASVGSFPTLQSVVPTARIRKEIRDVAVPARQSSPSIPVAQATTATAQVMVLLTSMSSFSLECSLSSSNLEHLPSAFDSAAVLSESLMTCIARAILCIVRFLWTSSSIFFACSNNSASINCPTF